MKQTSILSLLSFRYSQVREFVMYAGSRKGAVTCDTAGVEPRDLWAAEIEEKENLYKGMSLVFIDNTRLKVLPHDSLYTYRIKTGVVEIQVSGYDRWVPFAYGDRDKLTIRQGLTGVVDIRGMEKKRSLNTGETCWGAFNYAGLSTLSMLKGKNTKIAWCNIHYTFQ